MKNQLILAEQGITDAYLLNNDAESLLKAALYETCDGNFLCGSTFGLCFSERSEILLCDEAQIVTNKPYVPTNRVTDLKLAG